jgi:hypothetical protein
MQDISRAMERTPRRGLARKRFSFQAENVWSVKRRPTSIKPKIPKMPDQLEAAPMISRRAKAD